MDKIIPFNKGIHRQPSLGEAGELSECVNLIPVNGELVNVRDIKPYVFDIGEGEEFMCIHKTLYADVYVFRKDNILKFYTEADGELLKFADDVTIQHTPKRIEVIGNVLAIVTDKTDILVMYQDGGYVNKGEGYPDLPITFSLDFSTDGSTTSQGNFVHQYPSAGGYYAPYKYEDSSGNVINGVEPMRFKYLLSSLDTYSYNLRSQIASAKGRGRFTYPFFVQCAFKTSSGDYVSATPPVLMLCTTGSAGYTHINPSSLGADYQPFNGKPEQGNGGVSAILKTGVTHYSMEYMLRFKVFKSMDLSHWKDIITSVDFFVSDEIVTSTEDLKQESSYISELSLGSHCISSFEDNKGDLACRRSKLSLFSRTIGFENTSDYDPYVLWEPDAIEASEFIAKVANVEGCYLMKSIPFDEFLGMMDGKYHDLPRVATNKEKLLNSTESRIITSSRNMVSYNNRLIKVGNVEMFFNGDNIRTVLPALEGYLAPKVLDGPNGGIELAANTGNLEYEIVVEEEECCYYVIMEKDNTLITVGGVANEGTMASLFKNGIPYFCYPDSDAKAVIFKCKRDGVDTYFKVDLTQTKWWPGISYAFNAGASIINPSQTTDEPFLQNNARGDRSLLSFSKFEDPFTFDETDKVKVSFGEILNIASSTKALSQGQFGQFPMYAFCTDGIWALEVDAEGRFYSNQPISRDVCNNPDSITQVDGAVVFTTDQGLMMIEGSNVVCLSESMRGFNVDESIYFPPSLFDDNGCSEYKDLIVSEKRDFREILKTCKIAYDYTNRMLRIIPKEYTGRYYVFSLETREYASVVIKEKITSLVPGYPSTTIQIGNKLYKPSEKDDNSEPKLGLLLTRPIHMDEPFAMKKLQDMRLHYSKFDGTSRCKVIVYASDDGAKWTMVRSLRKGSYKQYRFAVLTKMKDMDALSGMVLRYELERTNKLR